ncbi:unnamed protein product, partial [Ectocarpus sp. 6 AP-2014]
RQFDPPPPAPAAAAAAQPGARLSSDFMRPRASRECPTSSKNSEASAPAFSISVSGDPGCRCMKSVMSYRRPCTPTRQLDSKFCPAASHSSQVASNSKKNSLQPWF